MSRFRILVFVSALSAATTAVATAQGPADVRTEVQTFVRQYIDVTNRADASALSEMYARVPEVTTADNTDITRGWEAIRKDIGSLAGMQGRFRIALDSVDVVSLGPDHALAVAAANFAFGTPQGSLRVRGVITFVLSKVGGAWKVLHDHSSYQSPGGE